MCRLLSLKADDTGINREELIYEIFNTAREIKDSLNDDIKLLIWQFVEAYGKIPRDKIDRIKKEAKMGEIAESITEYYTIKGREEGRTEGEKIGIKRGEEIGIKKGRTEGKIEIIKAMLDKGFDTSVITEVSGYPKYEIESLCVAEETAIYGKKQP